MKAEIEQEFDNWFFGTEGPRPTDLETVRVDAVKAWIDSNFIPRADVQEVLESMIQPHPSFDRVGGNNEIIRSVIQKLLKPETSETQTPESS